MLKRMIKGLWGACLLIPICLMAAPLEVTLYYVGSTDTHAWAGVEQGQKEANLQGQFLGQNYTVKVLDEAALAETDVSDATAILLATSPTHMLAVAQEARFASTPVFNINADDDGLREVCQPNLFNVPPSNRMKNDALAQWQAKHPDVTVTPRAWHETFRKFAAAQLNNRFRDTHDYEMDDDAWAGWAAVKMLSDSVARTQSTDAATMQQFLKNDLAFDGQKGNTATFRPTGQLTQIVLLIDENNKIAAEAPLRGVKGGIDSLGLLNCK
jgi:ABC-type branched-subunit amino acid transport system substrate-binding protein